jgi:PPOX class probable F420-dependent enzyme
VLNAPRAAILDRPLTAVVATTNRNGSPHAVPVWFRHEPDSGRIRVWSDASRHWVRNLLRDPRCSITIAEHEAPFAGYLASCTATVHEDADWAGAEIHAITARYIPAPDVDAYIAQDPFRTIVELTPGRSRVWDRGY